MGSRPCPGWTDLSCVREWRGSVRSFRQVVECGGAAPRRESVSEHSVRQVQHEGRKAMMHEHLRTLPTVLCLSASVTDAVPQESNLHAPGAGCYVLNYVGRYAEATGRLHFAHLLLVTVAPYLSLATC